MSFDIEGVFYLVSFRNCVRAGKWGCMFGLLIEKIKNKDSKVQNDTGMHIDRDSVCMGDDCVSHEIIMNFPENARLSQLMQELIDYVPSMSDVVWAVQSDAGMCGYIITDRNTNASFELCGTDRLISEMQIRKVFCKYYYPSLFSYIEGGTGREIEKYSECSTFLEKVKKDNSQFTMLPK